MMDLYKEKEKKCCFLKKSVCSVSPDQVDRNIHRVIQRILATISFSEEIPLIPSAFPTEFSLLSKDAKSDTENYIQSTVYEVTQVNSKFSS